MIALIAFVKLFLFLVSITFSITRSSLLYWCRTCFLCRWLYLLSDVFSSPSMWIFLFDAFFILLLKLLLVLSFFSSPLFECCGVGQHDINSSTAISVFFLKAFFILLQDKTLPFLFLLYFFDSCSASSSVEWYKVLPLQYWKDCIIVMEKNYHSLRSILKVAICSHVLWSSVYPFNFVRNSNSPSLLCLISRSSNTMYSFLSSNSCWYFCAVSLDILTILSSQHWALMEQNHKFEQKFE